MPTLREVEEHVPRAGNVLTVVSRVQRAQNASERPPTYALPESQAYEDGLVAHDDTRQRVWLQRVEHDILGGGS